MKCSGYELPCVGVDLGIRVGMGSSCHGYELVMDTSSLEILYRVVKTAKIISLS